MIEITVQTRDGNILGSFNAEKGKLITTMATEHNVEIPMSCGAGACGLCLCEILQGGEFIEKGNGFMDLDENQVLACIATIKDECFENNVEGKVILKRMI